MSLRSPAENENTDRVMPAWIAGIQVRKDSPGNIRVNLDSSTPCWNDAIEGPLLKVTEVLSASYFHRRVTAVFVCSRRLLPHSQESRLWLYCPNFHFKDPFKWLISI